MKLNKTLGVVILLSLLLAGLSAPAATSPLAQEPGASQADLTKVDPTLLDQLALDGQSEFYVILTIQADVSGAAALPTKEAKGTYVFNLLRETARQTQQPLLDYLKGQGLSFKSMYIQNMIRVWAGRTAVEWLAARSDVARIVSPPDPRIDLVSRSPKAIVAALEEQHLAGIEWNITRVGAPDVWAMGFHGEGMVVGDNDTGAEYTHPALVNHYRGNLGGGTYNHNYNWWDTYSGSPTPVDSDGHGTHTCGTMVGDDGGANQIGMAPGAKWIACRGMNLECLEFFLAPWDLTGANPDPTKAPDAVNNSWYDSSGFNYQPIIQSLNAAGVAVIKSAGNLGSNCSTISNPGYVPEIIATAAFAQGDTIASFSSRGPMSNYGPTILKPEVAAPGVNVRSSVPGGGYDGTYSGTSMAAPHSTGLVALIWSAAPCLRGDVPTTKQIMMETAESKIDAQCPPFVGHPNDVWGWGILDAQAAVQTAMGYCGGMGGLQGTVTAAGSPLEGVDVLAEGAGGFSRSDATDIAGLYAMALISDTYTVTATKYGYGDVVVPGVEVVADVTITLDIAMTALPVHTVSGYVRETGTNAPLIATVEFTDAPVPPVATDASGYYEIQVAEGTWHLKASAPSHTPDTQEVVVAGNTTQDFYLDPLPCILLVDDDNNSPDTLPYFTAALNTMALDYNVFDTAGSGGPDPATLAGYKMVIWFSGDAYGGGAGPNSTDETNLAAYLDAGGRLFLSSQDYLYDMGLTSFGSTYLGISSYTDDSGNATAKVGVAGDPIGNGLGTLSLSYPSGFSDYGDIVTAGAGASQAFRSSTSVNLDVDKAGAAWKTVFFGTDWVPIYNNTAANGITVLQRIVDWFDGCACEAVGILDVTAQPSGCTAAFSASLAGTPPFAYTWDFGAFGVSADPAPVVDFGVSGTYPFSLTVYNCAGGSSDAVTDTVTVECCIAVTDPDFNWDPVSPLEDQEITFTGVASGADPITYAWDFGDGATGAGQTATHTYAQGGSYTVVMTATNCSGAVATSTQTVVVRSKTYIYLPILIRAGGD